MHIHFSPRHQVKQLRHASRDLCSSDDCAEGDNGRPDNLERPLCGNSVGLPNDRTWTTPEIHCTRKVIDVAGDRRLQHGHDCDPAEPTARTQAGQNQIARRSRGCRE
jgi:hypothetical protein